MKNKYKYLNSKFEDEINAELFQKIGSHLLIRCDIHNILSMNENLRFEITSRVNLSLEKYFKKQKRLFLINDNVKQIILKNIKNEGYYYDY